MSSWRKEPPNHEEWLNAKSNGYWWVKFLMMPARDEVDEETGETFMWRDVWHTDMVQICDQMVEGRSILDGGRLVARGNILKEFYLDDPEATEGLYWQPVVPAEDNDDKEPK